MNRQQRQSLEHAKLQAQEIADTEESPVGVLEVDGEFRMVRYSLANISKAALLYTAYPTTYEELTPNDAIAYNGHAVRFTTIRTIEDDEGNDAVMEATRELWDVEYARKVQSFLNKVLE